MVRRHAIPPPRRWLLLSVLATLGCEAAPGERSAVSVADPRRCKPSLGTTGTPATIAEAVELINALPSPVTAECFVEALDRPLRLEASNSRSSLQRASGDRSPRLFIFSGETLVIAIVLDGKGRDLIEFGETGSGGRSLKGELEFPLRTPISGGTPHRQIRNLEHPKISRCFVCHDAEQASAAVPHGLESLPLQPAAGTLVPVASLLDEHARCDASREPARCAYLEALVTHGPIEHHPFERDTAAR